MSVVNLNSDSESDGFVSVKRANDIEKRLLQQIKETKDIFTQCVADTHDIKFSEKIDEAVIVVCGAGNVGKSTYCNELLQIKHPTKKTLVSFFHESKKPSTARTCVARDGDETAINHAENKERVDRLKKEHVKGCKTESYTNVV